MTHDARATSDVRGREETFVVKEKKERDEKRRLDQRRECENARMRTSCVRQFEYCDASESGCFGESASVTTEFEELVRGIWGSNKEKDAADGGGNVRFTIVFSVVVRTGGSVRCCV